MDAALYLPTTSTPIQAAVSENTCRAAALLLGLDAADVQVFQHHQCQEHGSGFDVYIDARVPLGIDMASHLRSTAFLVVFF